MDIFIEKLVMKKKDKKDLLFNIGIIVAALVLFIVIPLIPLVNTFALVFYMVVAYGAYYFITSRNLEFEYIITNGDIDIDKIISRRKRKRIFSANCKDFDIVAKVSGDKYTSQEQAIKNRIEAVSSMTTPDVYFATLNYKGDRTIVFFELDEKILSTFKTFIPRKVFI